MDKIIEAFKKFGRWVKLWLWEKPISKPEPEKQYKLKATEVAKEFMVVQYHGQRINLHISEYPTWKTSDRKTKRAMKEMFAKQEKEGLIRWVEIEGKPICVRNLDYEKRAEKTKQVK